MERNKILADRRIFNSLCQVVFFALTITTLIMLMGFFVFDWFQNPPSVEEFGNTKIYSNYAGVGAVKLRIVLALLLAVILVWFPKQIPKKIKLLPYIWIIFEYILWAVGSYQIYSTSENGFTYKGIFFLYDSNWWDIIILLLVLVSGICLFIKAK